MNKGLFFVPHSSSLRPRLLFFRSPSSLLYQPVSCQAVCKPVFSPFIVFNLARLMKTGIPMSISWSSCLSVLGAVGVSGLAATYSMKYCLYALKRDRCALVRCHPWRWVRRMYQRLAIYHFAWKVSAACLLQAVTYQHARAIRSKCPTPPLTVLSWPGIV